MKRFNQNQTHKNETLGSKTRWLSSNKSAKKHQAIAGAIIFAVIILHFISQFIFFRGEKFQSEITLVKPKIEESVEIRPKYETKSSEIVTPPVSISPIGRTKLKISTPPRAIIKKKEPRLSRTERLRRAEKILTGI